MSDFDFDNSVDVRFRFLTEGDAEVIASVNKLKQTTKDTGDVANQLSESFAKISRENQINAAIEDARKLRDEVGDADAAATKLVQTLQEVGATGSEIESAARKFSDFQSQSTEGGNEGGGGGGSGVLSGGLRSAGRALDQLGLNSIGVPIQKLGDLGLVTKEFKNLSDQIPVLTSVSEALTPTLGASAAGFAAVAAPIALIAAAAIPLALALKEVNDEIDRNVEAHKQELDALKAEADQQEKNNVEARTKTSAQNRQDIADTQFNFATQEQLLQKAKADKARIDKEYADLGSSFNPAARKELAGEGADADKAIEDISKNIIDLGTNAQNLTETLGPAIDAREKEQKAIEDANKATNERAQIITQNAAVEQKVQTEIATFTKDQAQARIAALNTENQGIQDQIAQLSALPNRTGDVTNRLKELGTQLDANKAEAEGLTAGLSNLPAEIKNATNELTKLQTQIDDVEAKRKQQTDERIRQDKEANDIGQLQLQIDQAKNDEAKDANKQKLEDDREAGADAEAAAVTKQQQRITQIYDQFFQTQLNLLNNYIKSETRADQDHSTQRIRQLQDLYVSLTDLAGKRDVAAFVSTRSQGLTNIARGDEDFNTAAQRRRQDYEDQARENQANFQRQLTDLQNANAEENATRRAQLQKKLDDDIAAGQVQLKQSDVLQKKLSDLRDKFAAEDLAARRQNEDTAYNTQISQLKTRQSQLNAIIGQTLNPAVSLMGQLGNAIVNFINQVRNAATAPSTGTGGGGGGNLGSFAYGARSISKDGNYRLHAGEGVLTRSENRNYIRGGGNRGGGNTVIINNPMFGELVTPSMMHEQMMELAHAIPLAVT